MQQQGDLQPVDLLNSVPNEAVKPSDVELLASRVINSDQKNYPRDALHIFAENSNAKQRNLGRLQSVKIRLSSIAAVDKLPANILAQKGNILKVYAKFDDCKTGLR